MSEVLSNDAKPRYKVLYEDDDGDEELYSYAEEIVPLMQVCLLLLTHQTHPRTYFCRCFVFCKTVNVERKRQLVNAMNDVQKVLFGMKKDPDDRNDVL